MGEGEELSQPLVRNGALTSLSVDITLIPLAGEDHKYIWCRARGLRPSLFREIHVGHYCHAR